MRVLLAFLIILILPLNLWAQEKKQYYFAFPIAQATAQRGGMEYELKLNFGSEDGLFEGSEGITLGIYSAETPNRNTQIGQLKLTELTEKNATLFARADSGQQIFTGDIAFLAVKINPPAIENEIFQLAQFGVSPVGDASQPLFAREKALGQNSEAWQKELLSDWANSLHQIAGDLQPGYDTLQITQGDFKGQKMTNALKNAQSREVLSFIRYVLAGASRYLCSAMPLQETYVNWLLDGAKRSHDDLALLFLETPNAVALNELQEKFAERITETTLGSWKKMMEKSVANGDYNRAIQLTELNSRFYKLLGKFSEVASQYYYQAEILKAQKNHSKAIKANQQAIDWAKKAENEAKDTYLILEQKADIYADWGKTTEAEEAYRDVIKFAQSEENKKAFNTMLLATYQKLGKIYETTAQYQPYLELQQAVLTLQADVPNSERANTLYYMGWAEEKMGNADNAMSYFKKSIALYDTATVNGKWSASVLNRNIGILLRDQEFYDSAIFYMKEAGKLRASLFQAYPSNEGAVVGLAEISNDLGDVYIMQKHFDKALSSFQNTYELRKNIDANFASDENRRQLGISISKMGEAHGRMGNNERLDSFYQERVKINLDAQDTASAALAYWDWGYQYNIWQKNYTQSIGLYETSMEYYQSIGDKSNTALLQENIAVNYYKQEQYKEALSFFNKALKTRNELASTDASGMQLQEIAEIYDNISEVYQAQQKYDEGIEAQNQRLALAKQLKSEKIIASAEWDLGVLYANKDEHSLAIKHYEKALTYYRNIEDEENATVLLRNIATNQLALDLLSEAREGYQENLDLLQKMMEVKSDSNTAVLIAQAYSDLASVEVKRKKYDEAIKYHQKRKPLYEQYQDLGNQADTYWDIAIIRGINQKKYSEGIELYHKAISIYERLKKSENMAILYNNIAINLGNLHLLDSALFFNQKALAIHQQLYAKDSTNSLKEELADDYEDIGSNYRKLYAFDKSVESLNKSIELRKEILDSENSLLEANINLGQAYSVLADIYTDMGEHDKAIALEKKRLVLYQKTAENGKIANAYFNIAYRTNQKSQNYEQSIEEYRKAYTYHALDKDTSSMALCISNIAQNHWSLLNYDSAITNHLEAVRLAESIQENNRIGDSWGNLATLYKETDNVEKSLEAFNKSIDAYSQIEDKIELINAYQELADVYRSQKAYNKTLEFYQKALSIAQSEANIKAEANIWLNMGMLAHTQNQFKQAEELYVKAQEIQLRINDKSNLSTTYCYSGVAAMARGEFNKSEELLNKAIDAAKEVNNQSNIYFSRVKLADLMMNKGQYKEAKVIYQEALKYYESTKKFTSQIDMMQSLAWLKSEQGLFDEAIKIYQKAYLLAEKSADPTEMADCNANMSNLYRIRGEFEKAREKVEASHKIFIEQENLWGIASALLTLGNLNNNLGEYAQAIQYFQSADSIYQALGNDQSRVTAINSIGTIYYWQGNYEKAVVQFKQALEIINALHLKDGFSYAVRSNLAEVYMEQGKFEEAEKYISEAIEGSETLGDKSTMAIEYLILGKIQLKKEELTQSEENLLKANEMLKELKLVPFLTETTSQLGKLYYLKKQIPEASKYLSESVGIAQKTGVNKRLWEAYYHQGLIAKSGGKLNDAKELFIKAVKVLEDIQSKIVGGEESKQLFNSGEEKVKLYDALIGTLIENGELDLALQYLDRSNNEDLRNQFKQLNVKFTDKAKSDAIAKEKELKTKLDNIELQLSKEKGNAKSEAKIRTLEATKQIAEEKYIKFVNETFRSNPELSQHFSKSINPIELKTDKNRKKIPEDIAMVSYLPGENQLYIFVATSDTVVARIVEVERKEITKRIKFLRAFGASQLVGHIERGLADLQKEEISSPIVEGGAETDYKRISEELYNYLIAPVEAELQTRDKVGIIPSGMLHILPFQMLGAENKDGKFTYLVERHTIFYANSLKMLERLIQEKPELQILAMGNADNTLPAAEMEVANILDLYPNTKTYIGDAAKEDIIKSTPADVNVLHFATHGNLDFYDFHKSYLTLASNDAKGEDGRLTIEEVWEIEGLYNCQLVTLSACQTAISEGEGGWPVSPATSFIDAGANTVVASLWSVSDEATGKLMKYFYTNLEAKMEKSEALRQAQIQLSKETGFSHPYFWAPFVLIGDWR